MKDYSLNAAERKKYILSYKIEDKKIIAKLASGEFYTIPYTKKNEQSVISKMEVQARNAKIKPLDKSEKILSIYQPLMFPLAIAVFISHGGWFNGICLAIVAGAIVFPAKRIMNAIKERDIKKLNYFLDHQQELNDNVGDNENMLLSVSKKTVSQIKAQQAQKKKPFNINNIDNYSLRDLRTLKENLERISSFCFNEDESTIEEKGPVFKKKLDHKKK